MMCCGWVDLELVGDPRKCYLWWQSNMKGSSTVTVAGKGGAPKGSGSVRTEAVVQEIIDDLSVGITLREICRRPHMPSWHAVYSWMRSDEELASRIARARELGFDAIAEEALDIADDGTNDWVERRMQDGSKQEVVNSEHIQRSKLRIETRLKLLAKWSPKRYGDRQDVKLSGDADQPVQVEHKGATPEQLAALTAALLSKPKGE